MHGYIGASAIVCRTAESLHLLLRERKYCCKIHRIVYQFIFYVSCPF